MNAFDERVCTGIVVIVLATPKAFISHRSKFKSNGALPAFPARSSGSGREAARSIDAGVGYQLPETRRGVPICLRTWDHATLGENHPPVRSIIFVECSFVLHLLVPEKSGWRFPVPPASPGYQRNRSCIRAHACTKKIVHSIKFFRSPMVSLCATP